MVNRDPLAPVPLTEQQTEQQTIPAAGQQAQSLNPLGNGGSNKSSQADHSPWYISFMLTICGLLAGSFLTGFISLSLSSLLERNSVQLLVAAILIATGWALYSNQRSRQHTFFISLAFALSLSGQAFFAWALIDAKLAEPLGVWLVLALQLLLTLIMPNLIHRLFSSVLTLAAMVYLLQYYHAADLSAGLLAMLLAVTSLQRYQLLSYYPQATASTTTPPPLHRGAAALLQILRAVTYASALLLLLISVLFIMADYSHSVDGSSWFAYRPWLAQGLLILAALYSAYLILKRYQMSIFSAVGLLIATSIIGLGIFSFHVSGLLATSLVIVIAVANSQRVLLGLAIIALVGYVFWYYYQLDTSLLLKSGSMLMVAIALSLVRWLLVNRYFSRLTQSREPKL